MVNVKFSPNIQKKIKELRKILTAIAFLLPGKWKKEISEQRKILREGPESEIDALHAIHHSEGVSTAELIAHILYTKDSFWIHQGPLWLRKRMTYHKRERPGPPPPETWLLPKDHPKKTDQYGESYKTSKTPGAKKWRKKQRAIEIRSKEAQKKKEPDMTPHPDYTPEALAKRKKWAQKKQKERKVIEK